MIKMSTEREVNEEVAEKVQAPVESSSEAAAASTPVPEHVEEQPAEAAVAEVPEGKEAKPERRREAAEEGEEAPAKAKKAKKSEEEEEGKVVEEKTITVNLKHAYLAYSRKPAPRSVRLVKKVASKAFHTDDVKIDNSLNSMLWSRGKTKAMRRVTIKLQKMDDDTVRVLPVKTTEAAGA